MFLNRFISFSYLFTNRFSDIFSDIFIKLLKESAFNYDLHTPKMVRNRRNRQSIFLEPAVDFVIASTPYRLLKSD